MGDFQGSILFIVVLIFATGLLIGCLAGINIGRKQGYIAAMNGEVLYEQTETTSWETAK